jgi:hypothetical protein
MTSQKVQNNLWAKLYNRRSTINLWILVFNKDAKLKPLSCETFRVRHHSTGLFLNEHRILAGDMKGNFRDYVSCIILHLKYHVRSLYKQ